MKKLGLLALGLGLTLSACGTTPPQVSGNGGASIGVAVGDANSTVNVTRTVTPATEDAPEKITWSSSAPGLVEFIFMSRPGSAAAYITGYRITRYDYNGQVSTTPLESGKLDIYVTSGYDCPERTALRSCSMSDTATEAVPANGLPTAPLRLNFAGALVSEVQRTLQGAYSEVDIEFTGHSANGAPIVVRASGINSIAYKLGD